MRKNSAPDFIKVNMLLYRIDTCFFFLIYKISDWSLNSDWSFNIALVLENMLDGHIRILGNRKKVCYKYNVTDFF